MIVRSGSGYTHTVLLSSSAPAAVTWRVFDAAGVEVDTGTVAPPANALSFDITVPGSANTLAIGSFVSSRDLVWSYMDGGKLVTDELRYSVEARAPYGVSPAGVRAKLGLEPSDVPDSDISLVRAYLTFQSIVNPVGQDPDSLVLRDAIEATAAIQLIPSLRVRIAKSEDTGTNKYQRQDVDWDQITTDLEAIVLAGYLLIDPDYDSFGVTEGTLFILATPATDPITGAAPTTS